MIMKQRARAIEVDCRGVSVMVISAYFPHAGLQDDKVEALHDAIDDEVDKARRRGSHVIIGGDFNAEVGARQEGEQSNPRGETMAKWA